MSRTHYSTLLYSFDTLVTLQKGRGTASSSPTKTSGVAGRKDLPYGSWILTVLTAAASFCILSS